MDTANTTAFDGSRGLSLDDLLPESQRVHTPEPEYEIYEPEQPPATRRHRPRWRRWTMYVALVMLTPLALSEMVTLSYRWFTPPRTSFMLQDEGSIVYQYVDLDHISRYMIAAVIAHEDQRLGMRAGGFEISDLTSKAREYMDGDAGVGGSTIPQQLVKNIFLWPGRSAIRKGLEAVMATEFSYSMSDQRILELYLNYAQFGPGLYGVCAASWYYFNTPPWFMSEYNANQLSGVLPRPAYIERAAGGGIYLGPDADQLAIEKVNIAARFNPGSIAALGGWEGTVATVGITDTALDHSEDRGEDSCSTMPDSVAERLETELGQR